VTPKTGRYQFILSSDNNAELWIALDTNDPSTKTRVVDYPGHSNNFGWLGKDRASQWGDIVDLEAGKVT
jgi:hypothetical protein